MAERKLTLKEIVDKVYIDLPEDENIREDEPSSENKYFTDDDCTNDYESVSGNECINSLKSNPTNEDNIMLAKRNDYDWVPKWRKKVIKSRLPPFNCVSGPNITFNTTSIGLTNVFLEFFTKDLLNDIVLYIKQIYMLHKN